MTKEWKESEVLKKGGKIECLREKREIAGSKKENNIIINMIQDYKDTMDQILESNEEEWKNERMNDRIKERTNKKDKM